MCSDNAVDRETHKAPWFIVVLCGQFSVLMILLVAKVFPTMWHRQSLGGRSLLAFTAAVLLAGAVELARHALVFAGFRCGKPRLRTIIPRDTRWVICCNGAILIVGCAYFCALNLTPTGITLSVFGMLTGLCMFLWSRHSSKLDRESDPQD